MRARNRQEYVDKLTRRIQAHGVPLKVNSLIPSERLKPCTLHLYAWTGSVPCTGVEKCLLCNHVKTDRELLAEVRRGVLDNGNS